MLKLIFLAPILETLVCERIEASDQFFSLLPKLIPHFLHDPNVVLPDGLKSVVDVVIDLHVDLRKLVLLGLVFGLDF